MKNPAEERWIRRLRDDDECKTKLICFPHAGAGASVYRTWPAGLPSGIGIMAVRYPGRDDRFEDRFPPGLEALAADIADALGDLAQHRLVLFGHCMGASVAHEVALRLQERGYPPAALCVSARRPPQALADRRKDYGTDEDIIAHAVSLDASSAAFFEDPDLREAMLPAVLADYALTVGYSGGQRPPLPCPIYGYIGDGDPELSPEQMHGWADMTQDAFQLQVLAGGHFYLKSEEATLLADLSDVLESAKLGTTTAA
jgi:pyochelin biosynthetic protein PchC